MKQHYNAEVQTVEQMQLTLSVLRGLLEEVILGKCRAKLEVIVYDHHTNNVQIPCTNVPEMAGFTS